MRIVGTDKLLIIFIILIYAGCSNATTLKHQVVLVRIENFEKTIFRFKNDTGRYPTTEEGLKALVEIPSGINPDIWKGPYIDRPSVPPDPWWNQYNYIYPAKYGNKEFDLYSCGKNGINDHGLKDDITNWGGFNTQYYSDSNKIIFKTVLFLIFAIIFIIGWKLKKQGKTKKI